MIHPTYRSLDAPLRLVGLSWRQWLALIAGGVPLVALAHWLALPTKPAVSICTVLIGVPLSLAYLSEETGFGFGQAISDIARWAAGRRRRVGDRLDWLLGAEVRDDGLVVLRDGGYARVLEVDSVNPLVMDGATAESVAGGFARVAARIPNGQSLQLITQAETLPIEALIAAEAARTEAAAASRTPVASGALHALAQAQEESLRIQAAELAAVSMRYFVVVPWRLPRRFGSSPDHARAQRDCDRFADGIATDLETLDVRVRLTAGAEIRELLRERAPSVPDDRAPGELELGAGLEQVLYLGSIPDQTWLGWLLHLMQAPRPFTLAVHVHATDRYRERAAQRRRHRRLWGLNRGTELRGRPVDPAKQQQEDEAAALNEELAVSAAGVYRMSVYLRVREPTGDRDLLREQVESLQRDAVAVCDARLRGGRGAQRRLWQATLPLGVDVARRTRKYVARNVGDSFPLIGTRCGSPDGLPLGYAQPGRTLERLDPFDPAHENHLLVVNGKSGTGKTMTTILLLLRVLARGGRGFILDRAGHFEFLASLVPGSRCLVLGAGSDGDAINPWDVADAGRPGNEKVDFLLALHALLVGRRGDDEGTLDVVESNQLGLAIRAVYDRCALTGEPPRELLLQEELYRRAGDEQAAGAPELAARLRMLAESLHNYVGDGPYAYLVDRPTSVAGDAPLVAFDTRRVPDDLAGAVLFTLTEHVTRRIEGEREEWLAADERADGPWEGRSFLVIDEAWKLVESRATARWVNELARRSRHLALFLVAISQQLSDFASEHGRALLANASMLLLFRQLPEELEYVREALRLSEEEVVAVAALSTAKRQYSNCFFVNGTRGRGVVSVRVGPREYWMATNDPGRDEPLRRSALRDAGGDPWAAVEALAHSSG